MCDDLTDADNAGLSRRAFALGASAVSLAALLPSPANALTVASRAVTIDTPDGPAQAFFAAPSTGRHPAVLVWPDARQKAMEWRKTLTPEATTRDATAFVRWLDRQRGVDTRRGMAVTGYCMGGPMAFLTAVAFPGRVRAIGSFHGAGLVTDAPDSPHRLVPKTRASALIAIAQNDDARAPGDKDALRAAYDSARKHAEIAVYPANHGWCPPDSPAYDRDQAERAWARLLVLLKEMPV